MDVKLPSMQDADSGETTERLMPQPNESTTEHAAEQAAAPQDPVFPERPDSPDGNEKNEQSGGEQVKGKRRTGDIVAIVIMAVLSVILIPVLAVNLSLIIKGSLRQDVPPDIFGVAPLAVTSGSMDGSEEDSFPEGALIFVRILSEEEKQDLKIGDVVTFRAADNAYVTHRIVDVTTEGEQIVTVTTRGDANAVTDGAIAIGNVIGICTGHVNGLGDFSIFLQTPSGILVFIGIPVLLFIAYDVTRIILYNRRAKREAAAEGGEQLEQAQSELDSARNELRDKEEELARLRAQLAEREKQANSDENSKTS